MGCSACAAKRQQMATKKAAKKPNENSDCEYTSEMINDWLDKLICVQSRGILNNFGIQRALYNSFIGVLKSIKRKPTTVCYFKIQLDIINPYILNIINYGIC